MDPTGFICIVWSVIAFYFAWTAISMIPVRKKTDKDLCSLCGKKLHGVFAIYHSKKACIDCAVKDYEHGR